MHEPVVHNNIVKRGCKKVVEIFDTWFVKYIIRPVFFLLPPSLLTMMAVRKGLQSEVITLVGKPIGEFLNHSALLIIVGTFLYMVLMKAIYAGIENYARPSRELEVGDLIALVRAIDIVVGDKTKRMSHEAKLIALKSDICGKETFNQITRPDQQIPLLITGLKNVFEYMDKLKTDFRVGLLKIEKNKPIDWYSFEPASFPPRTEAKALGATASTVSQCIKTKSIIVVDDIQKELSKKTKKERRFIKGSTQDSDNGSQLCYPLIHPATGKIEYVITIAGNRSGCLKEKHIELYDWIIKHFAVRVSLEHSLLIMKEKANE